MTDGGALNIREILRQLGVKDPSELPLIPNIQPTLSMGDAGGLASPLLPPLAWAGGALVGNGATTHAGFQFQSLGAGGAYIRWSHASVSGAAQLNWQIAAAAIATATSFVCPNQQMSPDPVASVLTRMTTLAPIATGGFPVVSLPVGGQFGLPDMVFVPRGSWFSMTCSQNNVWVYFNAVIQDVPAAALTPSG